MKKSYQKYIPMFWDEKGKPFGLDIPLVALLAANVIPLLGVIFLKWDIFYIVFFYWAENLAVGLFNILKIAFVKVKPPAQNLAKLFMIPFFMFHYGIFTAGHGFFIIEFFGDRHMRHTHHRETWPCIFVFLQMIINVLKDIFQSVPQAVKYGVLSLFISHGISFVYNFLIKGEYTRTSPAVLMGQPYVRVVIMHITIIIGGILLQVTGSPAGLLIVLVGLKTFIDINLHKLEHKKAVLDK